MTGLEYVLAAVFAAVWLVPLTMAVRWERRLRTARRTLSVPSTPPSRPAPAPSVTDRPAKTGRR
jgi:hypothetical protein